MKEDKRWRHNNTRTLVCPHSLTVILLHYKQAIRSSGYWMVMLYRSVMGHHGLSYTWLSHIEAIPVRVL